MDALDYFVISLIVIVVILLLVVITRIAARVRRALKTDDRLVNGTVGYWTFNKQVGWYATVILLGVVAYGVYLYFRHFG